jgi:hypothetical protein
MVFTHEAKFCWADPNYAGTLFVGPAGPAWDYPSMIATKRRLNSGYSSADAEHTMQRFEPSDKGSKTVDEKQFEELIQLPQIIAVDIKTIREILESQSAANPHG